MVLKRIKVFLLLIPITYSLETSPVLLLDQSNRPNLDLPALKNITREEFVDIFKTPNSMTVIFVDEIGDRDTFMSCRNETCFPSLQKIPNKHFYRQVADPVNSVESTYRSCTSYNETTVPKLKFLSNSCAIVNLTANCSIQEQDRIISEFYTSHVKDNMVILYTPKIIPKPRKTAPFGTVIFTSPNPRFDIVYERLDICTYAMKENKKVLFCEKLRTSEMKVTNSSTRNNTFNVNLSFGAMWKKQLNFEVFKKTGGYFKIANMTYGIDRLLTFGEVEAPINFSYVCGRQHYFQNQSKVGNHTLSFKGLQMQAFFNQSALNETDLKFEESWDCVGAFVSGGIIMGLFVCGILLLILMFGINSLMNINTNDKFENPNGKPLTIHASN